MVSVPEKEEEKPFMNENNSIGLDIEDGVEFYCCGRIQISSYGLVEEMYPFILGNYEQIETNHQQITFVKTGPPKMFLIQPETTEHVWGYTWGVSRSAKAKWGYIKSSSISPCPTMAGRWKVYDQNIKRWVMDKTLLVECSGELFLSSVEKA